MQIDTREQYDNIRERQALFAAWLGDRHTYLAADVPADVVPVSNEEMSSAEFYDYQRYPELMRFVYVNEETRRVTTWIGDVLGQIVHMGLAYRSGFGRSVRHNITVRGVNGRLYHGQYFVSSGNYARLKLVKGKS